MKLTNITSPNNAVTVSLILQFTWNSCIYIIDVLSRAESGPRPSRRPPGSSLRSTTPGWAMTSTPTKGSAKKSPLSPASLYATKLLGKLAPSLLFNSLSQMCACPVFCCRVWTVSFWQFPRDGSCRRGPLRGLYSFVWKRDAMVEPNILLVPTSSWYSRHGRVYVGSRSICILSYS